MTHNCLPPVDPSVIYCERLKTRIKEWYRKTRDKHVISMIKNGVKYVTRKPGGWLKHRNTYIREEESSKLKDVYEDYIQRGILVKVDEYRPIAMLNRFPVEKASDGHRLVTNFKPINKLATPPSKFKLTRPMDVQYHLLSQDWLVVLDLKDAYNHLHLHTSMPKTGIEIPQKGKYMWRSLGFGLAHAPEAWVRTLRAALKPLRKEGVRMVDYMDDILVMAGSAHEASVARDLLIAHLEGLGIMVNYKKSSLQPEQVKDFLGFTWDTKRMVMGIPMTKREKVRKGALLISRRTKANKTEVAMVHGMVVALLPATSQMRCMTRSMQQWLTKHTKEKYKVRLPLDQKTREELKYWGQRLNTVLEKKLECKEAATLEVWSDASDKGWGAHTEKMEKETIEGLWSPQWVERRIEEKELWTATTSLIHFVQQRELTDKTVTIHTDSTVALSYLWEMKGGRKRHLQKHLHHLWKVMKERNITVLAEWISTHDNTLADKLSRKERSRWDYSISHLWFNRIQQLMGVKVTLDCFATLENRRVKRFVSRFAHPKATWVDCLQLQHKQLVGETLWMNPPWKIIPRVLQWVRKIKEGCSQGTPIILMLVPYCQGSPWWPLALNMAVEYKVVPRQQGLFEDWQGVSLKMPLWSFACFKF